jgi:hypothetical protein
MNFPYTGEVFKNYKTDNCLNLKKPVSNILLPKGRMDCKKIFSVYQPK